MGVKASHSFPVRVLGKLEDEFDGEGVSELPNMDYGEAEGRFWA